MHLKVLHLDVPSLDSLEGLVGGVDGARPQLQAGVDQRAHLPIHSVFRGPVLV